MMGLMAQDGAPFITFPPNVSTADNSWLTTQGLPNPPRSLYPIPRLRNDTLAADRIGADLATDAIFRCIDEATAYAGLQNGVFDKVYFYEFDRSYQTGGWPALDLCEAPKTALHPLGDPDAKIGYSKCHSGELYYVFGNIKRQGLQYRDGRGDEEFEKEIIDRWAAFAWGREPNVAGRPRWRPSVRGDMQMMALDWPRESMTGFRSLDQCSWLDLPLDYYL
jgi:carboxylesterase type B